MPIQGGEVNVCECCGDSTDGLFPIIANKHDDGWGTEHDGIHTWCGLCYEIGSCMTPYGGTCYRGEWDEEWSKMWEEFWEMADGEED